MPPWSDVLPARPRRFLLAVWALLAFLNLCAGLVIASWPERQTDLDTIRQWGHDWLVTGNNIYAADLSDYPPHAIVALSPLGILSHEWAVRTWTILNLGFAVAAAYLAIRVVRPRSGWSDMALPVLMFLCWGGFRTLLQFSLVTIVFGLLAMTVADRRPGWSGFCLGLALMKPQVAVPFLLWAIVTRRLRVAAIGLSVPIAGLALFCFRAGANPVAVLQHYAEILGTLYVSNEDLMMVGLAQLRPVVALVVSCPEVVNAAAIGIAAALLATTCVLGFTEGTRRELLLVSAPPLAGVWSLLTFYHLTYGFILLLPTATLLMFLNDPATRIFRRSVFWTMQIALMIDVPRLAHLINSDETAWASGWPAHADRALMAALFACLCVLAVGRLNRGGADGLRSQAST